jgi:multidrug resistance efflux pump
MGFDDCLPSIAHSPALITDITMNPSLAKIVRGAATVVLVAAAALVLRSLWIHYKVEPWTRDGRVRADVVEIAADVSGLVSEVRVHDDQIVKAGDTLFVIDRERFQLAVSQATATREALRVQLDQSIRENRRDKSLGDLVSAEVVEQSRTKIDQLRASIAQADATLAQAKLNLDRTQIKAPVDGIVTNLDLRPGDYANAGHSSLALIDTGSLYVVGYFEETKLPHIAVGDAVRIQLMGDDKVFSGHIESIAGGIEERDRAVGQRMLANVTPTFNWVRLAQRIPIRVAIDKVPADVKLIVGRTATVTVVPPKKNAWVRQ